VRDYYRRKRITRIFKDVDDGDLDSHADDHQGDDPEAVDRLMKQEFWKKIGTMMDTLPRMEREVFLMRFFEHHSIREIAEILRKSESTVKTHLYRSLDKFRKDPSIRELRVEEIS
jgi:RNA polymerase sigma factor (sigma-70 family)